MSIRTSVASAALAAVLAAGSIPTAQAQSFHFGFGIGSHGLFEHRPLRLCLLTDSQLRRAIQRQGYRNIYLNVEHDQRIQARATKGRWVYLLLVNACTGRVLERERLRPA